METFLPSIPAFKKLACVGTACAVFAWSGCSSGVAPSKTASSAGTGALIGGLGGAAVGGNSSMGTATGAVGGALGGALIGGIVGMVQEAKDRKEQDRLSQERAYQQDLAKKRSADASRKQEIEEELAIAQGYRISDVELSESQKALDAATERLKKLNDERATAIAKTKTLADQKEKRLQTEAKIAAMEEELSRLKGDDPMSKDGTKKPASPAAPAEAPPPLPAAKPGN